MVGMRQIDARREASKAICVACLVVAFLSTVNVATAESRAPEGAMTYEDGAIVLSVSNDKGVDRAFFSTGKQVIFRVSGRKIGSERPTLEFSTSSLLMLGLVGAPALGEDLGTVHVVQLAPGNYVLDDWRILTPSGIPPGPHGLDMDVLRPAHRPPQLVFEVHAGKTHYLGNLHAQLLHEKRGVFGAMFLVGGLPEVRDRKERDLAIALEKFPSVRGPISIDLLPQGVWSGD